jgi:integrase
MARPKRSSGPHTGGNGDGTPYLKTHPKTGIYQIWYYDATARGMRSRTTGTRDYREAEEKRAAFLAERYAERPLQSIHDCQLATAIHLYLKNEAPKKASEYQAARACEIILTYWGASSIADLTATDTRLNPPAMPLTQDKFVGWLQNEKEYADGYIHRILATLSRVVHFARESHIIHEAPFIRSITADKIRERWLTREEVRYLLASAAALGHDHVVLFIKVTLQTTARPEALFDLTWQQCKFQTGHIQLNPDWREQTRKLRPTLPMTEALRRALLQARPEDYRETDYVLRYCGRPVRAIKKSLRSCCDRAEAVMKAHARECGEDPDAIDWSEVVPYTLRHTAATWMAQQGTSMRDLAEYLGHKDERMVRRHYWHHHPDFMEASRSAANKSAVWED